MGNLAFEWIFLDVCGVFIMNIFSSLKEPFFWEEAHCHLTHINIWIYFWHWGVPEDDKEMIAAPEIPTDFNLLQ